LRDLNIAFDALHAWFLLISLAFRMSIIKIQVST
jgi:hypothetical protein